MKLNTLNKAMTLMGEALGEKTTLRHMQVFLCVAIAHNKGEEIEVSDVIQRCGLAASVTSRIISALGVWDWKQQPGKKLLASRELFSDRRRKSIELSKAGMKLVEKLESAR